MKIDKIFPQLSCVPMYEQTHDDDAAAVMQPEKFSRLWEDVQRRVSKFRT